MSVMVLYSIIFIWHSTTAVDRFAFAVNDSSALYLSALHDVVFDHFPSGLTDLLFYQRANDPHSDLEHFDIINRIIQQLNETRTARIEQGLNVTDIGQQAKRLLNVIIVDGVESFRFVCFSLRLLCGYSI